MRQTEEFTRKSMENQRKREKIGCVIMASGLGIRFGSNKLLAKFDGKTLFERTLNLTEGLFAKRIIVTRTPEVAEICETYGADVILHSFPDRNDAVRLGVEQMKEMDGCIFCPCDQPLLSRQSIEMLVSTFQKESQTIFRLAFDERDGAPVLFACGHFGELACLPKKKGGGYLAKLYPDQVRRVQAGHEYELYDVDTVSDLEMLERLTKKTCD